jgi:hypothetical protein
MINDNKLIQEGAEKSTNFQGQTVNVYNGISYADVKEIALDIFNSNFIHLKNEAALVASQLAEEITGNILVKLNNEKPELLQEFKKPAMQEALYIAQKEYAKSGDKDLGDLLIDIVVDRAGVIKRNMLQVILDESLLIAPKLTVEQMDSLTLNFLLFKTVRLYIGNFEDFKLFLNNYILPFIENLLQENHEYNYLEFLRCGKIITNNFQPLEVIIKEHYKGIFSQGFTIDEFNNLFENAEIFLPILGRCFHDESKIQILACNNEHLKKITNNLNIDNNTFNKLESLYNRSIIGTDKIKNLLLDLDNRISKLFEVTENTFFRNFQISPVGIAIAHANYRRRTGETLDLSIWTK